MDLQLAIEQIKSDRGWKEVTIQSEVWPYSQWGTVRNFGEGQAAVIDYFYFRENGSSGSPLQDAINSRIIVESTTSKVAYNAETTNSYSDGINSHAESSFTSIHSGVLKVDTTAGVRNPKGFMHLHIIIKKA